MSYAENPYEAPQYTFAAQAAENERASFIAKTYMHLAGAIAAFVALEVVLFNIPGFKQKTLELMTAGIFNAWIEKSLTKLGVLMPGRYAKFEQSSGFIDSIDSYAYRSPKAVDGGSGKTQSDESADSKTPAG